MHFGGDPDRTARPDDEAVLRAFATRYFPDGAGATVMLKACIFTNTPDEHFIVDRLPESPQVSVAAVCSGHGYKFCSVVGEIMSDLVTEGQSRFDLAMFSAARFGSDQAG